MPRGDLRQTFMFSATFPSEIQKLARDFLRNYVWIAVGRVGSTVENIRQQLMLATSDPHKKMELLIQALGHSDGRTLIFVQKKKTATWLCDCLRSMYGVAAEEIHGDRSQSQREYALRMFRDGNIRILVATDVAARGLDVPQVTHVIQFDMPISSDDFDVYVHRIGRTGRAGQAGLATSFFVPGKEAGEGNGSIAQKLMTLLVENNQEVPEWFAQLDDLQGGRRGHHGGGHQRGRFGYHDTRSNQHNTLYSNKGGNNHRGHGGGGGDYQHGGGSQYYGGGGGGGGGGYQQQSRGGFGGNRGGGGGGMGGYGGTHGGLHGGPHGGHQGQPSYPSHQHNANQQDSYYAGNGVGAVPGAPSAPAGGPTAGYVVTSPTSQASSVPPAAPVTSPTAAAAGGAGAAAAGANPAFSNSGYYDAYSATFVPAGSAAPPAPTVTTPGVPAAPSVVPPAAPDVTPPAAPSLGFDQGAQSWLQQQHQQQPPHMGGYQDRRAGYGGQPQHQQHQHHMGGAGGYQQSQYGMGGRGGSGYGGFPGQQQQQQPQQRYQSQQGGYPQQQQQPQFHHQAPQHQQQLQYGRGGDNFNAYGQQRAMGGYGQAPQQQHMQQHHQHQQAHQQQQPQRMAPGGYGQQGAATGFFSHQQAQPQPQAYGQQPQRAAAYGGGYPAAMAQQQPGFYRGGYEGAEDPAAQFQHYQAAQQHYSQVPQQAQQVPASYPGVEGAAAPAVSVGDEAH